MWNYIPDSVQTPSLHLESRNAVIFFWFEYEYRIFLIKLDSILLHTMSPENIIWNILDFKPAIILSIYIKIEQSDYISILVANRFYTIPRIIKKRGM